MWIVFFIFWKTRFLVLGSISISRARIHLVAIFRQFDRLMETADSPSWAPNARPKSKERRGLVVSRRRADRRSRHFRCTLFLARSLSSSLHPLTHRLESPHTRPRPTTRPLNAAAFFGVRVFLLFFARRRERRYTRISYVLVRVYRPSARTAPSASFSVRRSPFDVRRSPSILTRSPFRFSPPLTLSLHSNTCTLLVFLSLLLLREPPRTYGVGL